jgi:hypothetical protein
LPGQELRDPKPDWQAWFDRQKCDECGQNHPTKWHHDVGIRNRKYIFTPSNHSQSNRPPTNRARPTGPNNNRYKRPQRPIRYRPGGKKAMGKAMHKAWLEFVDPEDHDLMAHLADGVDDVEPEMFANVAEGDESAADDADDDEANSEENIFKAFAVAGLESLNWQAA